MHASIILFVSIFLFSAAAEDSATATDQCGPTESWVAVSDGLDIENCEPGQRCDLVKGTNKRISLSFTPKNDIETLHARVHGLLGELPVPFMVPQENACEESGLSCPLKANEKYTYSAELPIKTIYPQMSVQVKWELIDNLGNIVTCKVIPVRIVKARKS